MVLVFLQVDVVLGVQFLVYTLWIVIQSVVLHFIFVGSCRVGLSINPWIRQVQHMSPLSIGYFLWLFYWDRRNWTRYSFGLATIISLIIAGASLWLWWSVFDVVFGVGMFLLHFFGTIVTGSLFVILIGEFFARQHPALGRDPQDRGPIKRRKQKEAE